MGHWGVKSYENDDAHNALDAAFEQVHGDRYDALLDDDNPLTFEQVQERLASRETLAAALALHAQDFGEDSQDWDEIARLTYAGIVVRHAELRVAIPVELCRQAIDYLEHEEIDWDEETRRRLRREKEILLLKRRAEATS